MPQLGSSRSIAPNKVLSALKKHVARKYARETRREQAGFGADELAPGDMVLLEAGDHVSADGRLVVAVGVEVDESALTGESHAVAKQTLPLTDPDTAIGDRLNMMYMNTMLTARTSASSSSLQRESIRKWVDLSAGAR